MASILYFSRTMDIGGAENVVYQLCKSQKENFDKIIVCSSGGKRVNELEDLDIRHYYIHDIDDKNPIFIVLNFIKLFYIIVSEKVDIIHTHHRMAAFYIKILNYLLRFKNIYTAHNVFENKQKLTNFSLNNVDIIAVGESVKKNLISYFKINPDQITVIYNTTFEEEKEFKSDKLMSQVKKNNGIIISNIGRLSEQKGMKYFIEAARILASKFDNIYFFIIGSGEEEEMLKRLTNDLNLSDRLFFLGYRTDVKTLMRQSDLICLTSLWEGLPLVPIEAISLGKIVIATNVGGTCEIIEDNVNGYIIYGIRDADKITKKIEYVLTNQDEWDTISHKAKDVYSKKFSSRQFVSNHLHLYKKILLTKK